MPQIKAGIINVTGYVGAELARLLCQHPQVELVTVTGRSAAGQKLGDVFPNFAGTDYIIKAELDSEIDIAFSAMPHKSSVDVVPSLLKQGIKVVDASADFRLKNAGESEGNCLGLLGSKPGVLQHQCYPGPGTHSQRRAYSSRYSGG